MISFIQMMKGKTKKGAMELSIGTIVIIVLAMSMLIFGMILLRTIFEGAIGVAEMSDEQIMAEVGKLFGEDKFQAFLDLLKV